MTRTWSEPRIAVQRFVADAYVAACWKINCNVPTGFGFFDNNGNAQYDRNIDEKLTSDGVYGCGTWHTGIQGVPDDGPSANAMWQPQRYVQQGWFGGYYQNDGNAYDVYYWRDGNGRNDVHFSKVDDAQWESNPNAS